MWLTTIATAIHRGLRKMQSFLSYSKYSHLGALVNLEISSENITMLTLKVPFLFFIFCLIIRTTYGWNLDRSDFRVVRDNENSYFGYTLAVYKQKRLLVGSPGESNFGGAAYECSLGSNGIVCTNAIRGTSGSWMGATIVSDNQESAMVCAPRRNVVDDLRRNWPLGGTCYVTNLGSLTTAGPAFRSSDDILNKLSSTCFRSLGFSAAVLRENGENTLFASTPTCAFGVLKQKKNDERSYDGLDRNYPGFAMASGYFGVRGQSQSTLLAISIGFHENSSFAGKVYFYETFTDTIQSNVKGSQPGEHFGGSLAVFDANGDRRDDVIIGAPHHTDYNTTPVNYEIGAVYIYYQTELNTFEKSARMILQGKATAGRFGYAVAGVGDINDDGFNELAVGAPYENDGKVYIYLGSSTGISKEPSQIISGDQYKPPINTFGFSITSADFDDNQHSDVVVGAYNSSTIAYLPARQIINVTSRLQIIPGEIKLDDTNCEYANGTEKFATVCGEIKFCIAFTSKRPYGNEISFNVSLALDANFEKGRRRVKFLENHNDLMIVKVNLTIGQEQCRGKTFYVPANLQETQSAVEAKMTVEMSQSAENDPRTFRWGPQTQIGQGVDASMSNSQKRQLSIPRMPQLYPIFPEQTHVKISNPLIINPKVKKSSWWEYVVAGVGAALILAIISGVLYKVGFFKRKLPPKGQTEEELTQQSSATE